MAGTAETGAAAGGGSPRLIRMQRSSLVLLIVAGTLNYFDRSALAIANPLIRKELGLSIEQMGLLLSAFLWAYAFCQFPGGVLVDRLGARRLLGASLALWSLAQATAGFALNLTQFSIARAVLGAGEAPMFPCAAWVTRAWFHKDRRSLVTGAWNCVSSLGPAIAPPMLTMLMLAFGWRAMFVFLGIVGLAISLVWLVWYRDPKDLALTSDEWHALGNTDSKPTAPAPPTLRDWRRLFGFRATWGMVLGYFGTIYLLWLFGSWLPGYLEMQRHMDVRSTGWIAAIPFGFGVVGSLGIGWLADRLQRAGYDPISVRKSAILTALVGMSVFTFEAQHAGSDFSAVSCIACALLCNGCCTTMTWSLVGEIAPDNLTASLGSIINFGGYLGGAMAPLATGLIVQRTGDFSLALLLASALAAASALAFLLLVPDHRIVLHEPN